MVSVIKMNKYLRVFLILAAILVLALIVRKIRKSEIQISDSVFWFFFAGSFVLLAIFPQIAFFFSNLLGFEAPSNFIFLYVIAVLVMREFSLNAKFAHLRLKLNTLIQEMALRENDNN